MRVLSLCQEDPWRGGHGNPLQHSCLENPWTEEPGGLQSMGKSWTQLKQLGMHAPTHRKSKS